MTLLDQIPGYREAIEQEQIVRDAAFIHSARHPLIETIEGFEVVPITFRHFLLLRLHPVILLGAFRDYDDIVPSITDLKAFLWLLNPKYSQVESRLRVRFLKRCDRELSRTYTRAVVTLGIRKYLKEKFGDWPPQNTTKEIFDAAFYSDACSICACLSREYGWRDDDVLDMPIARTFQYLNEIKKARGAKILFNPSDRVRADWLKKINEEQRN